MHPWYCQGCFSDQFQYDAQWRVASLCFHGALMMGCAWLVLLGRPICSTDPSTLCKIVVSYRKLSSFEKQRKLLECEAAETLRSPFGPLVTLYKNPVFWNDCWPLFHSVTVKSILYLYSELSDIRYYRKRKVFSTHVKKLIMNLNLLTVIRFMLSGPLSRPCLFDSETGFEFVVFFFKWAVTGTCKWFRANLDHCPQFSAQVMFYLKALLFC